MKARRVDQLSCLLLGLIAGLWVLFAILSKRSDWKLSVEGFSSAGGQMAVYLDRGAGFSEFEAERVRIPAGAFEVEWILARSSLRAIRWDGLDRPGEIRVDSIQLREPGRFRGRGLGLGDADRLNEVRVVPSNEDLKVSFLGNDGWILFPVDPVSRFKLLLVAALPSVGVFGLITVLSLLWNRRRYARRRAETPEDYSRVGLSDRSASSGTSGPSGS